MIRCLVLLAGICLALTSAPAVAADEAPTGSAPIDFERVVPRESPNDFLACPADYCREAGSYQLSPRFEVPVAALRARLDGLLAQAPRVTVVHDTPTHVVVEQKSAVFRFVDVIDIRLIEIDPATSTLAIYSRSNTGYYDFGVNESRVKDWLGALQAAR